LAARLLDYEKDRKINSGYGRGDEHAVDLGIRPGEDYVASFVCHRAPLCRFWPRTNLWMRSDDLRIKPENVLVSYWERSSKDSSNLSVNKALTGALRRNLERLYVSPILLSRKGRSASTILLMRALITPRAALRESCASRLMSPRTPSRFCSHLYFYLAGRAPCTHRALTVHSPCTHRAAFSTACGTSVAPSALGSCGS
jgi:hypothetical protein